MSISFKTLPSSGVETWQGSASISGRTYLWLGVYSGGGAITQIADSWNGVAGGNVWQPLGWVPHTTPTGVAGGLNYCAWFTSNSRPHLGTTFGDGNYNATCVITPTLSSGSMIDSVLVILDGASGTASPNIVPASGTVITPTVENIELDFIWPDSYAFLWGSWTPKNIDDNIAYVAGLPSGGLVLANNWNGGITYYTGDLVTAWDGPDYHEYLSLRDVNLNHSPATSPTYWSLNTHRGAIMSYMVNWDIGFHGLRYGGAAYPDSAFSSIKVDTGSFGYITASFGPGAPYPPDLQTVAPASGSTHGGTSITIHANYQTVNSPTYFQGGATVTVKGAPATNVVVHSIDQITCTTPAGQLGAADVVVTNWDGQSDTLVGGFTYTYGGANQVSPVFGSIKV